MVNVRRNNAGMSQAIEAFHTKEYFEFISQIGFIHPTKFKILFLEDRINQRDKTPLDELLRVTGLAKIYSLEGNFTLATENFQNAYQIADSLALQDRANGKENPIAYLHYEYGVFLRLIEADDKAELYFTRADVLAVTERLKKLIEFQRLLNNQDKPDTHFLFHIKSLLEFFRKNKMTLLVASTTHRQGIYQLEHGDFGAARENMEKALKITEANDFQYLRWNILNTIGLLIYKEESNSAAIQYFEEIIGRMDNNYFKAIVLNNLANRYFIANENQQALTHFQESLTISRENNITSQIPRLCFLLGKLFNERFQDRSQAYLYYRQSYEEIIAQSEFGIPIAKTRKKILKGFIDFMIESVPDGITQNFSRDLFRFAIDRPWEEIKDLFHYNLFIYHYLNTGVGDKTFAHLKVSGSTFYSLRIRLKSRGVEFPDFRKTDVTCDDKYFINTLQTYIGIHRSETWTQINQRFEREMYNYLFKSYGYNKKALAEKLELAYTGVLVKAKRLIRPEQYSSN